MAKPSGNVSIKDIARHCGLSVATVSHVLNGRRERYSAETEAKVLSAVQELGYAPNHIGRMLRKGNDWLFGALVPNLANIFYADFVRALDQALQQERRLLLTITLGDDPAVQQATLQSLQGAMLSGLVVVGSTARELHELMALSHRRTSLVFVNRGQTGLYAQHLGVGIANFDAGHALAQRVLAWRRRRIAVLRGPDYSFASRQRYEGFIAGLNGDPGIRVVWDQSVELTAQAGFEGARAAAASRPDALFCGNDMVALGALEYFSAHGFKVPHEVLILGFDYNSLTRVVGRRLLTVAQPVGLMAETIARWLTHPETSRPDGPITLPFTIVEPQTDDDVPEVSSPSSVPSP